MAWLMAYLVFAWFPVFSAMNLFTSESGTRTVQPVGLNRFRLWNQRQIVQYETPNLAIKS
jgi:hypothetical protein